VSVETVDLEFAMKTLFFGAILAAYAAFSHPALAYNCDDGFKGHMKKMQVFINRVDGYTLADALRKSVNGYDSCKAGDDFSPHGVWDKIEKEMASKIRK
jgi:hypothetical protein